MAVLRGVVRCLFVELLCVSDQLSGLLVSFEVNELDPYYLEAN
jgi:hypothetical protein